MQVVFARGQLSRKHGRLVVSPHGLDALHLSLLCLTRGSLVNLGASCGFDAGGMMNAAPHASANTEKKKQTDEDQNGCKVDQLESTATSAAAVLFTLDRGGARRSA